ncbi:uncharacterized protein VTP21DRAFT_10296 [Calcarisporiella thermophila]|uniref:uncharacterized protein n=1 Tax=Calcarisporiella thermophila TaxID=911321 RepID=UPI003744934C
MAIRSTINSHRNSCRFPQNATVTLNHVRKRTEETMTSLANNNSGILSDTVTVAGPNAGESGDGVRVSIPEGVEKTASDGETSSSEQLKDETNIPHLSYAQIFRLFLFEFGIHAWGGPIAQIALLKDKLVIRDKWISVSRYNRAYGIYQMIPGPEAAELCMYFGSLAGGWFGGFLAGLGFLLPGFILMLALSYLYTLGTVENPYFTASFIALKPVAAAMVVRAVHKIADHSFISSKTNAFDNALLFLAFLSALQSVLRINFFITLGVLGIFYMLWSRRFYWIAAALIVLQYVGFILYVVFKGFPSPVSIALGITPTPDLGNLFALGLVAGSLSFGGAYTAIPFVQAEAVIRGAWLSEKVFLDGIALANVLPAPLVIFSTFIGFQGGQVHGGLGTAFAGAILMTVGIFIPCFLLTLMGHRLLEKLANNTFLSSFFEGITAAIVGIIGISAADLAKSAILIHPNTLVSVNRVSSNTPLDSGVYSSLSAIIFLMALGALYTFKHRLISIMLIATAALAGQILFLF